MPGDSQKFDRYGNRSNVLAPMRSVTTEVVPNMTPSETDAPVLVRSRPLDGSETFPTNADIILTVDRQVMAGNGDIIVSNGSDTRTIATDDASQVFLMKLAVLQLVRLKIWLLILPIMSK